MTAILLRYDLRIPPFTRHGHAEAYAACLEQCAWAEARGAADVVTLSEHHGLDDGYLPAPLTLAAAIAGRTRRLRINVAAALLPLHDPVRLAEQMAVLDLVAPKRLSVVVGLGYRPEEFAMAGVDPGRRGALLEEAVGVMRQAWSGEPFVWRGRTVRVTPKPVRPLRLLVGGSTPAAARRAARLRCGFAPAVADDELVARYQAECARQGFEGLVIPPSASGYVHVSEDPERDWEVVGPHALWDARTYAAWQMPAQRSQVHSAAETAGALRASGVYRVVTPDECVALARAGNALVLHPLMGGLPPEVGWRSLELFATQVLPRLERT